MAEMCEVGAGCCLDRWCEIVSREGALPAILCYTKLRIGGCDEAEGGVRAEEHAGTTMLM